MLLSYDDLSLATLVARRPVSAVRGPLVQSIGLVQPRTSERRGRRIALHPDHCIDRKRARASSKRSSKKFKLFVTAKSTIIDQTRYSSQ